MNSDLFRIPVEKSKKIIYNGGIQNFLFRKMTFEHEKKKRLVTMIFQTALGIFLFLMLWWIIMACRKSYKENEPFLRQKKATKMNYLLNYLRQREEELFNQRV